MHTGTIYNVTTSNVTDCQGNLIAGFTKASVGLPVDASRGMIINEVLFHPRTAAHDYVELYNNSDSILDASHFFIANRNSSNAVASIVPLTQSPRLVFPGNYIVVTEDAASLAREYLVKDPTSVLEVSSLPSFPSDKGFVILLNHQGNIVDEVDYSESWHFKLLANAEGVALERIDPSAPPQDPENWHSAGSTAGYGTPGYKNSQYKTLSDINVSIEVTPKIFSPDNDGLDDVATIQYKVDQPGYLANVCIFDASGRPVKYLVRNEILAMTGYWNWDGLDDRNRKLPMGSYIVFTEVFNLHGKRNSFKKVIVLTRKQG